MRVFIGFDERQPLAYHVCRSSIERHAGARLQIEPLRLKWLPLKRRGLTDFTFSRYLCPWLCSYEGASLFMDAEADQMAAARAVGADRVEFYTEPYAAAFGTPGQTGQLQRFARASQAALDAGLGVNAGHDLNRDNLTPLLRAVPGVSEVSIGHALIADALELGYEATVVSYNRCIADAFA